MSYIYIYKATSPRAIEVKNWEGQLLLKRLGIISHLKKVNELIYLLTGIEWIETGGRYL
jgi:hypothetical protein